MIYVKQVTVTPAGGNAETLVDALTYQQGVKRTLKSITFDRVVSHDILVNEDRQRVVDMPSQHLVNYDTWLDLDRPIDEGATIKVGYRKTTAGAGAAQVITVKYEEV